MAVWGKKTADFTPTGLFLAVWGKFWHEILPQKGCFRWVGVKHAPNNQKGCFRWVGVKHAPNNQAETLLCALLNQFGVLFLDILVI